MSKFITGEELENAIYDIIWEANDQLIIVSPFINLDNYFKELFIKHKNNPDLHIIIVFGKNEKQITKSFSIKDFEFFKQFPNISIVYVPNLHAKYYGNDKKGVITSINLHDYSFKNNIEYGVFQESNLLNKITSNAEADAWEYSHKLAFDNAAIYINRPVFEKKLLGKNYIKSENLLDITKDVIPSARFMKQIESNNFKRIDDFEPTLFLKDSKKERPNRDSSDPDQSKTGFCIRTGKQIPFNPKSPYSKEAWKSWNEYKNYDYKEKYCHKTGKPSNGKTSMRNPILEE